MESRSVALMGSVMWLTLPKKPAPWATLDELDELQRDPSAVRLERLSERRKEAAN
jgi:hypothetical protein